MQVRGAATDRSHLAFLSHEGPRGGAGDGHSRSPPGDSHGGYASMVFRLQNQMEPRPWSGGTPSFWPDDEARPPNTPVYL